MKPFTITLLIINIALITFGVFFYFKQWEPTKQKVNCLQASVLADNPDNLYKNYRACLD